MSAPVGEPLDRGSTLADRVAMHLTEHVVEGTLLLGDRVLPERVLAEQYGVSRTVIREAVRMLASTGLVERRGGSGTYVRGHNAEAVAGPGLTARKSMQICTNTSCRCEMGLVCLWSRGTIGVGKRTACTVQRKEARRC